MSRSRDPIKFSKIIPKIWSGIQLTPPLFLLFLLVSNLAPSLSIFDRFKCDVIVGNVTETLTLVIALPIMCPIK